jgi:hypothetical protein
MTYTDPTLKKLFGLSGNECAFPGCDLPVIDTEYGLPIGQICHIKGKSPLGPRYDASQSEEERNSYENLLVMCSAHNTIVDHETTRDQFPIERLAQFKSDHESRAHNRVVKEDMAERIAKIFIALQPKEAPLPSVVPVIESHRTSSDNPGGIDYYAFRVSLRNDGEKTVRNFRLEVEIPNAYANPTHQGSMRESVRRVRGDVTVYRHTEEHFPGFVLFPKDTSDLVMNIDYQMRFDQYKDANERIKVTVYSDDDLLSSVNYSIAANRNKDRMDRLGL